MGMGSVPMGHRDSLFHGPCPVSDPLGQEDECSGVDRPAPGRTRPDRASASEGGWGP